jgi:predicted PurR-regulated permease PerM
MPPDARANPYRPLIVAGVLLTLAFILSVASKIFIPIALGILLTFILTPAVSYLQGRGLRRTYAVLIVVFVTAALVGGMMTALAVELRDLARELPTHKDHILVKVRDLFGGGPGIFDNLSKMLDEISAEVKGPDKDPAVKEALLVRVQQERSTNFGLLALLAGPLAATLGSISLTLALTVSMLLFREDLRNRMFLLLGEGHLTSTTRAMDEVSLRISRYLLSQVALNTAFGTLFGLGLALIGVNYALVWGALAAVLRFVPYIGTWMAAVFPVLVSIAAEGWVQPTLVIALAVVLGILTNYVAEPMLLSRTTGVIPIALVVATAFWTWIWGPIGLILATPITVCLSVLGRHVPSLGFLNVLLGRVAPLDPELKFYQRLLAHDEVEAADLLEAYLLDHSPEELFDQVLVSALARARRDNERGHLQGDELLALVKTTRELLDAVMGEAEEAGEGPVLLACPARDEVDELAAELFGRLIAPAKARYVVVSPEATAAEVLARVEQAEPAVVCLLSLPPGGSARARYLCKRLRARHAQLPIVAAIPGAGGDEPFVAQLRSAGATQVATTLAEARGQAVPLLQVARHLEAV